jgi:hypothetical protein
MPHDPLAPGETAWEAPVVSALLDDRPMTLSEVVPLLV